MPDLGLQLRNVWTSMITKLGLKAVLFSSIEIETCSQQQHSRNVICMYKNILIPESATTEMSTSSSLAMKPRTEKTAKPAKKLVKLFNRHRKKVSLQTTE